MADRRLRVLTVARDAGWGVGGAEVLVYEIVSRLDRARFEPYLCVTRAPLPERRELAAREMAELRAAGIQVLELNRESTSDLRPWARLLGLMRREEIDVVHAHMPRASVPATALGRVAGVPLILGHEHGSVLEGKGARRFLHRNIVGRGANGIIAVSEWDRQNLIDNEGIPASKLHVVRNGVDPPAQRDSASAVTGLRSDRPLVGAIGRLFAVKGYEVLVRAMGELSERIDADCVIIGDGPERGRLEALIAELGLAHRVRLPGFREDARAVIEILDVAVMPSHSEGAPLAMMEYMAAGAAIVATRVGGIPEMVEHERQALLVPPAAPVELAGAVERLLTDRALSRRLGDAARIRQREAYGLDVTVRELERLYTTLPRRRSRRLEPSRPLEG